ncbi:unnamed protein product, partial [Rotaria sp. Silwood1]
MLPWKDHVQQKGEGIRDEKVKVLRSVVPIKTEDVIIGQYFDVPKDSTTPTYAQVILSIHNERWAGVPFILRASKALNQKKAEIHIQFHDAPGEIFDEDIHQDDLSDSVACDELVIQTELDLTCGEHYQGVKLSDAYERFILDIFMGSKINFVRSNELQKTWHIVDPILAEIDKKKISIVPYKFGSRGLRKAFDAAIKHGYIFRGTYVWKDERSVLTKNEEKM